MAVKVRQWKGAWWLDIVYRGQRKRKRVGVGNAGKKAAELAAIKIQARLAEGDTAPLAPAPPSAPTFASIAEEWLRRYPALHAIRPGMLDNYRSFTERHLSPYVGELPVTDITVDRIEDFIEAKRAPGGSIRFKGKALSDASLRTGLLTLGLILHRAVRMKLIAGNPMREVARRHDPEPGAVDRVSPVDVAEPAEHDGEADPEELVGDDRPRDAENVGVERVGDGGKGDDEAAAGEPRDELPEHRVDDEGAGPCVESLPPRA